MGRFWILERLRAWRNVQIQCGCVFAADINMWGFCIFLTDSFFLRPMARNAFRMGCRKVDRLRYPSYSVGFRFQAVEFRRRMLRCAFSIGRVHLYSDHFDNCFAQGPFAIFQKHFLRRSMEGFPNGLIGCWLLTFCHTIGTYLLVARCLFLRPMQIETSDRRWVVSRMFDQICEV